MTLVEALGVGDVVALVGGAAIPPETTLVVPVVDADVFGQPLDAEHVHRARREQTFHSGRSR